MYENSLQDKLAVDQNSLTIHQMCNIFQKSDFFFTNWYGRIIQSFRASLVQSFLVKVITTVIFSKFLSTFMVRNLESINQFPNGTVRIGNKSAKVDIFSSTSKSTSSRCKADKAGIHPTNCLKSVSLIEIFNFVPKFI